MSEVLGFCHHPVLVNNRGDIKAFADISDNCVFGATEWGQYPSSSVDTRNPARPEDT